MLKFAFFVEGKTERIFIEYLINNYFTHPNFNIDSYEIIKNRAKIITSKNYNDKNVDYYFLIYDVRGDGKVSSAIRERANKLVNEDDYKHVFGLRDVYPYKKTDISNIESLFYSVLGRDLPDSTVSLILAVMEIEAWFLADYALFEKVDSRLTVQKINKELNINIDKDDLEPYNHPAVIINNIFQLIGKSYKKHESDSYSICSKIDFSRLCCEDMIQNRVPSFKKFMNILNRLTN